MIGTAGASLGKWARKVDANDGDAALTVNQRGTGNLLDLQDGGTSVFVVGQSGAITVGASASLTLPNNGLHLLDTDASHDLIISPGSNLTADRILTLTTGDAARTITLSGNLTIAADFITVGANSLTLTTSGVTNVTLPTTGTLITLAGTEILTNKTLTSPTINGVVTTTGLTLPAFILGDAVDLNKKNLTNFYYLLSKSDGDTIIDTPNGAYQLYIRCYRPAASAGVALNINGLNASDVLVTRATLTSGVNTAVLTFSNLTITGYVMTASEKINPVSGVAGFSVVSTALTLGSLGSVIIPQSAANATDALAGNIAGALCLDLTGAAERIYARGASGWFYWAKTGGLSMTKEERIDPLGRKAEIGDMVRLVVDKILPDGSLHAIPYFGG